MPELKAGVDRPVTSINDYRNQRKERAAERRQPSYEWGCAQSLEDRSPAVYINIFDCEHYLPNATAIDMAVGMLAMSARSCCPDCDAAFRQVTPGGDEYCKRHQIGWLAELLIERLRGVPECEAIVGRLENVVADEELLAALRL